MRFTKIPADTFKNIQLNAGVILSSFTKSDTKDTILGNIMGATTGGTTFTATHNFTDFGEDIDNCPKNTKELKKHDNWEISLSGTFVTITAETIKSLVGTAKVDSSDETKIVPYNDPTDDDFKDIWWVGDYSNQNGDSNGGYIAIHMMSALSTGGFQLQSNDKAKGQFAFTYTAHFSIDDQDTVPFEVFAVAGTAESTSTEG